MPLLPWLSTSCTSTRQAEIAEASARLRRNSLCLSPGVRPTISPFSTLHSVGLPCQPVRSWPLKKFLQRCRPWPASAPAPGRPDRRPATRTSASRKRLEQIVGHHRLLAELYLVDFAARQRRPARWRFAPSRASPSCSDDAGDDPAVGGRRSRWVDIPWPSRRWDRGCSTAGNRGSARFEPVSSGPILPPMPNSVWHCWQVLANTARPSDRSAGCAGFCWTSCVYLRDQLGLFLRSSRGRCPTLRQCARRLPASCDCATGGPGRPTDRSPESSFRPRRPSRAVA